MATPHYHAPLQPDRSNPAESLWQRKRIESNGPAEAQPKSAARLLGGGHPCSQSGRRLTSISTARFRYQGFDIQGATKYPAMTRNAKFLFGTVAVAAIVGIVLGAKLVRDQLTISLPDYPPIERAVWLDQNWTAEQRDWYHSADQGAHTFVMPYEWFVALEQPVLSLTAVGLLSDPVYLDRYGFIPGGTDSPRRELPIGFVRGGPLRDFNGEPWLDPQTKQPMSGIGLTCAACHTGRFTYRNTTVLIDGGSALVDIGQLRQGIGISVLLTNYLPYRFDRFADRVLGPGASHEARAELHKQLDQLWRRVNKIRRLENKVAAKSVTEGFGRLDAVTRIGNEVFGLNLKLDENFVGTSAPVHYPRLWNTSWYTWMHYNGSMEQPLSRNAGQALGSGAMINLTDARRPLYESSLEVKNLFEIETLISGRQPGAERGFGGLQAPKWPSDILPPIDERRAAQGAELYKTLCQGCHLPPVASPEFWAVKQWLPPNAAGQRYLAMDQIEIGTIGTDPAQAEDQHGRTVSVPAELGLSTNRFARAIGELSEKTVTRWYDSQTPPVSADLRHEMNGFRQNGLQAPLKYNVRPLNGIWATPPYLHNGSVPNLYYLLSPVAERPRIFYLGHREYDPVNVGYRYDHLPGGFRFDTTVRGNHNTGHEFNDGPLRDGVIGRKLTPDERRALIEYLKTL
jgi:processive rubber oxygenase RoxA-like protein